MLWLIPAALGVGVIAAGAISASKRKPLPIDVAGMLRSSLQTRTDATIAAALQAMKAKYASQVATIQKAWGATKAHDGQLNVPSDIDAMYMAAFYSGDPAQLKAVAQALDVKYHFLSTHLLDMASLLANLTPAAAA